MSKIMKNWKLFFYRQPECRETGPILVEKKTFNWSKSGAVRVGRKYARDYQWRLIGVEEAPWIGRD